MDQTIELEILGLSSNHSQSGSFTLVMGEVGGSRRLPIVIGMFEAQAIAIEIEKIIPKRADLAVFLRLLARSATGQLITTYSSHFHKPREGQEMHIVLLDNGRTRQLADPKYKNSLKCIR